LNNVTVVKQFTQNITNLPLFENSQVNA